MEKFTEKDKKLAHYEDLAKKNRLIELPCSVGDVVFELQHTRQKTLMAVPRKMKSLTEIVNLMESNMFNDTVFLDKDAADKACIDKQIQKGSDVFSADTLAHYIIEKCTKEKCPITHITLQNLLYLCQKQYLQEYKKPLFYDDFIAKSFGPSIQSVYFTYAGYGGMRITGNYGVSLPKTVTDCIDKIIETYRNNTSWEFEYLVRMDNGAWKDTYNNGFGISQVIPLGKICLEAEKFPLELFKGKISDEMEEFIR